MSPIPGIERAGEIYQRRVEDSGIQSLERIINSQRSEFGGREFNQPLLIFSKPFQSEEMTETLTVGEGIQLTGVSFDNLISIGNFVSEPKEVGGFDPTLVSLFGIGLSFLRGEEQIKVCGNWENAPLHEIFCGRTLFSLGYEIVGTTSLGGEYFIFREELGGLLASLKILPEELFEKAGEGVFVTELKDGVSQADTALLALPAGKIREIWERVREGAKFEAVPKGIGENVLCPIPARIEWPEKEYKGFFGVGARRMREKARLVGDFLWELSQDEGFRPIGVALLP